MAPVVKRQCLETRRDKDGNPLRRRLLPDGTTEWTIEIPLRLWDASAVPQPRPHWPEEMRQRVAQLHADGRSKKGIARTTGVPFYTVKNWLKKSVPCS